MKIYVSEGASIGTHGTSLADELLVAALQARVDGSDGTRGLRSGGVPARVEAARALSVPLSVNLDIDRAFNAQLVCAEVRERVLTHFSQIPVSGLTARGARQGQFVFARLFNVVDDTPGVLQAHFTTPTTNIAVPTGMKIVCQGAPVITGAPV